VTGRWAIREVVDGCLGGRLLPDAKKTADGDARKVKFFFFDLQRVSDILMRFEFGIRSY